MTSIFSKIILGEIPAYKIYEDEDFLAFLDAFPVVKGHTLVIPKKEIDHVFEIDDDQYTKYLLVCKRIASALSKAIPCKRVGSAIVGLEVPHAHIHLIPLNKMSDMDFGKEKLILSKKEFEEIVQSIKSYL